MVRRVPPILALFGLCWMLLCANALAQVYPPVPSPPGAPTRVVSPVVVVRGAPAPPVRGLSRTGFDTLPLVVLAAGSALLGVTLLGLTRQRHDLLP